MTIKRFSASKDNTITNAFKAGLNARGTNANMGASDIVEVFSIFGQSTTSSLEQTRILMQFPVDKILAARNAGKIPTSGSVSFKLKLFNAEHSETTPRAFTLSVQPLLQPWSEGVGLDMESYSDLDASNWLSASVGIPWNSGSGGVTPPEDLLSSSSFQSEWVQSFDSGREDMSLDITNLVEQWIIHEAGNSTSASMTWPVTEHTVSNKGDSVTFFSANGDYRILEVSTSSANSGKTLFHSQSLNDVVSSDNVVNTFAADPNPLFVVSKDPGSTYWYHTQSIPGVYGNLKSTKINTGTSINLPPHFDHGTGIINNGILVKLSGSAEDGASSLSYYTKKFFGRGSEFVLKRPVIEAQFDQGIHDDSNNVMKSSSLAPATENINNLFFYNRIRGRLQDIPSTGSGIYLRVATSSLAPGGNSDFQSIKAPDGTSPAASLGLTGSRVSKGIYKASFVYSGTATTLYPHWSLYNSSVHTSIFTGSSVAVNSFSPAGYYEAPVYLAKITNLKSAYTTAENAVLRVHTRDKNWQPNVYTKATQTIPIDIPKFSYYKLSRVTDNYTVVDYSTGSGQSYSRLSYDVSGSFFELDMSILEPNYLYEVSFLFGDGISYTEQEEKFRFRINP